MHADPHCPSCGRAVPPDAQFCPACGAILDLYQRPHPTGRLAAKHLLHGRYAIVRKLAQGGQSAVYLAADMREDGAERAIKEMSEADLSPRDREKTINNFLREAEILFNLQHPALAKVHKFFVEDRKHYLVMEYVAGQNLEDVMMQAGRPLEWERVVEWGIALCDVFTYLHEQRPPIIYRDLKPPNVMLTPEGHIKLVDFGIARQLYPTSTQDTAQLGTDGYAPPEQYDAHSEPRSDLYALGATMYHLLTGRVPESAPARLGGRALTPIRTHNPAVPETVERVVATALSLNAQDRFTSAARMGEALEHARAAGGAPQRHAAPAAAPISGARAARTSGHTSGHTSGRATSLAARAAGPAEAPARLHVAPLRLDAGVIAPGMTHALALEVGNRGGGSLVGSAETNHPCLAVAPRQLTQSTTALEVRIATASLAPGPYTYYVAVRTNGGDQIVPVRFTVRATGDPST